MLCTLDGPAQQINHYAVYTGQAGTTSQPLCCVHWTGRHDKSTTMLCTLDGLARQVNHYAVYTGQASTIKTRQAILTGLNHPTFELLCTQTQMFSLVQQIA